MKLFNSEELEATISGEVYTKEDKEYTKLKKVKNLIFDPQPVAIVNCQSEADVAQTIRYCRANDWPFTIKSTGHSASGFSSGDEKVVIDIAALNQVIVEETSKRVRVGGGANWFNVAQALTPYDLAITSGDMGGVGVGGNAQGSGMGFFVRKFGVTADRICGARLINADGEIVTVSKDEHPDLLWAIRGGAGNFGVITEFVFEAHEGGTVLAGNLYYAFDQKTVQELADYLYHAPEELNGTLSFTTVPFTEKMPKKNKNQLVIELMICFKGRQIGGTELLKDLQNFKGYLFDEVKPVSYVDLFPPIDPSGSTLILNFYTSSISHSLLNELTKELRESGDPRLIAQVKVLGGNFGKVENDTMAYSHRESRYLVILRKGFAAAEEALAANEKWKKKWELLKEFSEGIDINFLGITQVDGLNQMYSPANLMKLKQLKQKYDPTNCFSGTLNIQ